MGHTGDGNTSSAARLRAAGYVLLPAATACEALRLDQQGLGCLGESWERLPRDEYLRDGGRYRARRHSCFVQTLGPGRGEGERLEAVPHRPHWQPTAYNALHGGLTRWFEPIEAAVAGASVWRGLLGALGELFAQLHPTARWFIEAHQFRIDTLSGIGRPTPEGAHRDGVDFVAVILIRRHHVTGGETRVFAAQGTAGVRFTMQEPWSMLLLDDARVIHETTPIQPHGGEGVRDTLVLTYRAAGFQAPEASS
ncbi:MAG TPA: 2OG-Fe dioxygenase family protein [Candidatus Dormibacteraeota bacterium]|nr:2OG-Fe dioxygenase family protein [Candidatus Dormibacteraeota bacterium]